MARWYCVTFINLFKDYFSVNHFNELENPLQNSVTYITHHPERKVPKYRIFLLKSYNNLSRKGPLEVIYSNPQFRACVIRPGCSRTCLVESWKSLRAEIPKTLSCEVRKKHPIWAASVKNYSSITECTHCIYCSPLCMFLMAFLLRLRKNIWSRNSLQRPPQFPQTSGDDGLREKTGFYHPIHHLSQNIG